MHICGFMKNKVAVMTTMLFFLTFHSPGRTKKGEINLCAKLKTGGMEAFQTAISRGDEKIATLVEVSLNTMSISKALVFEDCSKPQTNLKTIIGTETGDRLHSACWASVGVISYSALGHGAPPFLKTQSQRGMNYWFCYSDQLASLSSLTLCRPTITLKGIWQGKKALTPRFSPHACTSSLETLLTLSGTGG